MLRMTKMAALALCKRNVFWSGDEIFHFYPEENILLRSQGFHRAAGHLYIGQEQACYLAL